MKIDWKKLLLSIAIPLGVGGVAALLTSGGYEAFGALKQPALSPPAWLFPVAWTILYVLMGIASYRICIGIATYQQRNKALYLYGIQLFFNFVWSLIFFNLQEYFFAFVWLVLLWFLVFFTWQSFKKIDEIAGWLLVPYLLWITFAGYLNLGIFLLN